MNDQLTYLKAKLSTVDGWQLTVAFFIGAMILFNPALGLAATFGDGMCRAIGFVTGEAGKAIATAAIITIAIGALLGRVSWGMAVMIAAGIAGIFGAPTIAAKIAGEDGDAGFCPTA